MENMKKEEILKKLVEELKEVSRKNNDPIEDEEECEFFVRYIFDASTEEIYYDSYLEGWPSWLVDWLITNQMLYRKYRK